MELFLPPIVAAFLFLALMRYGNTLMKTLRDPAYRGRAMGALHTTGFDVQERPTRSVRRLFKIKSFWRIAFDETGAVTLAEAAKLSENDLQRGVIETFIIESAVLDRIPLMEVSGNAYAYNEEAALPGVEFRAVNAAYVESTGTVNQKTESLVMLGGVADVDRFIVQTRGNLNDQRATQTRMKVKAAVYKFQDAFINGDVAVDANSFDGLKKRLTGNQVVDTGTNGLPVLGASDNDRHAFLDVLDEAIGRVPGTPDALYMNKAIRTKLRSSARRLQYWDRQRDEFGRSVEFYNGIPMVDIGTKADGTNIIPVNETQGTATDSSSIYIVKFGEDEGDQAVTGLENSPGDGPIAVDDLGLISEKPVYRTLIEFYGGIAVFGKGAARLRGVRNA